MIDKNKVNLLINEVDCALKRAAVLYPEDQNFGHVQQREAYVLNFIEKDLARRHGAKFRIASGGYVLSVAGVRTSCTAGKQGLLTNWKRSAEARLKAETAS